MFPSSINIQVKAMNTEELSKGAKMALLGAVEMSIDMYNDMALDPMYFNPSQIRELATKSDADIRLAITEAAKDASDNLDKLVELELIRRELLK
jgi:hypothetical protein